MAAAVLDGGGGGSDALQNLNVLRTLAEHCDPSTSFACLHVCRAWKEAFSVARLASNLSALAPVDRLRAAFAAGLHGSVCIEAVSLGRASAGQHGVDAHLRALAHNSHLTQLKMHLPVREVGREPQLSLAGVSALSGLSQLSALILAPPPSLSARAPHTLTASDAEALRRLRSLTFLELCVAVPPWVGLGPLAGLAAGGHLTALRTLAFGHASEPWQVAEVAELCTTLEGVSTLTDLRLRCVAPPPDSRALPALLALPLPQRLLNFALTFIGPGRGSGTVFGGPDDEEEEDGWLDQLAPRPGLHVIITEKVGG